MVVDNISNRKPQELEEQILAFIQRELLGPPDTVSRDDDLLSGELLDSVAVLRLAAFVQEEFRFSLGPSDFVVENFQNVAVLAEYVRSATAPAEPPSGDHR